MRVKVTILLLLGGSTRACVNSEALPEMNPVPTVLPAAREDASAYFGIFGPFQPGFSGVVPAAQGTLAYFMSLPEKPSGLHG